jgi:lipopolysaccharide transport system ATP-binding protein
MSSPIITVDNLGKKYRVNRVAERQPYVALRDVIADRAKRLLRFPLRGRSNGGSGAAVRSTEFWALKDVSLTVQNGEVVGIIGRNGAGKSTLLKVLSQITEPTAGRVRIRGSLASLLEVGTGFHPELTGRENIFLNGAILGMPRVQIKRKFDQIVAFAGVERFLDTPVKRYSSGMYVRLAFAVAAHLEPEILVVDEVLAVGDYEFQKKCLGKLTDMSSSGRTVLFVSHNMAAIKSLTTRTILLSQGRVVFDGATECAIQAYIEQGNNRLRTGREGSWGRGIHSAVRSVRLVDTSGGPVVQYMPGEPLRLEIEVETDGTAGMSLELFLNDATRSRIGMASTYQFHGQALPSRKGTYLCRLDLEPMWLASGSYILDAYTALINVAWDHSVESAFEFEVPFSNPEGREFDFRQIYGFGSLALLSASPVRFQQIGLPEQINDASSLAPAPPVT